MKNGSTSIRRHMVLGVLTVLLLVAGFGGWSAYASLSGAVIAAGRIVVDSNVKQIQHPYGGIVQAIAVDDGDRVKAGAVLFKLDETITRAELSIVDKRLGDLHARRARLEVERDGLGEVTNPVLGNGPDAVSVPEASMASERRVFIARRRGSEGKVSQLRERIGQLREETAGLEGQIAAKGIEISLVARELSDLGSLLSQGLVQASRVTALERDNARLVGERGARVSQKARTRGEASEIELQILQVGQDIQTEVATELRDLSSETAELTERKVAAQDKLTRMVVFAPIDGIVHETAIQTIGGVVKPAETVMKIVPAGDILTIEARVPPQNIDQITLGQAAIVRLTAFNQRTTPELDGVVERIAANSSEDERTGNTYYTVRIALPDEEMKRIETLTLMPGMPVEAFIQTAERTALNYFVKPLRDQFRHALREE